MTAGAVSSVGVAGPDVDRRRAVADAVAAAARERGRSARVVAFSSGRPALGRRRGLLSSVVRLLGAALRFSIARRRRRGAGVVVFDGSWFDLAAHSDRFGQWSGTTPIAVLLTRLVPRVDVVVIVDAAGRPHGRPDPTATEWAPWAWQQHAGWLGCAVVHEPSLPQPGPQALAAAAFTPDGGVPTGVRHRWVRLPVSRPSRDRRATVGAASGSALAVHAPSRWTSRMALTANRALVARGLALPSAAPVDGLVELCEELGIDPRGFAAFPAPASGRVAVAVADDRVTALVKFGDPDDAGLRREAAALERVKFDEACFAVPRLLFAGEWHAQFVVAMEGVDHVGVPRLAVDDIVDLCVALHRADGGGPVVHGDLARWNLLDAVDRLVVVDWEHARFEDDPLFDLAHFVVQDGFVRGIAPAVVASRISAPRSVAARYLDAVGLPGTEATPLFRRYVARAPVAQGYAWQVLEHVVA